MISASSSGELPTQVRWASGPERGFQHEPVDEFDGGVPVGAAGAVGHGHVVRVRGFQFPDGGPQRFGGGGRPRREQLIGQGDGRRAGKIWMGVNKAWW